MTILDSLSKIVIRMLKGNKLKIFRNKKIIKLKAHLAIQFNICYTEFLNDLDDWEDQNFEENKIAIKPTGVHLRKLEQWYMKVQGGEREPPCIIAPMFTKQCTHVLLWKIAC